MTLNRAAVEKVIVARVGARMTAAGMDGTTYDGTNQSLDDALWLALDTLGYPVATVGTVVDSDLVAVTNAAQLLDVAELRTLESIAGNLAKVDVSSAGGNSFKLGQLSDQVDRLIVRKQKQLADRYGLGLGTLSGSVIDLAFQGTLSTGVSGWYPFS